MNKALFISSSELGQEIHIKPTQSVKLSPLQKILKDNLEIYKNCNHVDDLMIVNLPSNMYVLPKHTQFENFVIVSPLEKDLNINIHKIAIRPNIRPKKLINLGKVTKRLVTDKKKFIPKKSFKSTLKNKEGN